MTSESQGGVTLSIFFLSHEFVGWLNWLCFSCVSSCSWDQWLTWVPSAQGRGRRTKEQAGKYVLIIELSRCFRSFAVGQSKSCGQVHGERWGKKLQDEHKCGCSKKWKLGLMFDLLAIHSSRTYFGIDPFRSVTWHFLSLWAPFGTWWKTRSPRKYNKYLI